MQDALHRCHLFLLEILICTPVPDDVLDEPQCVSLVNLRPISPVHAAIPGCFRSITQIASGSVPY